MFAFYVNSHSGAGTPDVDWNDLIGTSAEELWELVESLLEEKRRLAKMTEQERNQEAIDRFLAEHRASMGKPPIDESAED